jgi:hypothetical protein
MSEYDLLNELHHELYADEFIKNHEVKLKKAAADSQLLADYEITFSSDHGKRVLNDIVATGKVFHTTFTGNAWANYFEGFRSFALYIIHMSTRNKYLKQKELQQETQLKAVKKKW